MTPKVSVLTPVFNAGPYVRDAIESVLAQTFRDFELIAIDDGSRDDSLRTMQDVARTDPRVRIIHRENRGLIATRNELLQQARGELIAWMDADDVSYPTRLAEQVRVFDAEPELLCLGASQLQIDPEGMPIVYGMAITDRAQIRAGFATGAGVSFPTSMMRRAAVVQVGGFREPFVVGEDFDLILRLSEIGEVGNIAPCLLKYRQHVRSTSRELGSRWDAIREVILELAEERRTQGSDSLQRGNVIVIRGSDMPPTPPIEAEVHLRWARQALFSGFTATARKHSLKAISLNPRAPEAWRSAVRVALGMRPKSI